MKYTSLSLLLSIAILSGIQADDRNTLIDAALATRLALPKSYHLVLTESASKDTDKSYTRQREISVWAKGDLLRTDVLSKASSFDADGVGRREITCRNCVRPGHALRTRTGAGRNVALVAFYSLDASFDAGDPWRVDWRGLGLFPGGIDGYASTPYTASLDWFKAHTEGTVQAKQHLNENCRVLTGNIQGDVRLTRICWLRPDLGMNPVLFEASTADGSLKQRLEIEYSKVGKAGQWYPSVVRFTRTDAGEVTLKEVLTVRVADFDSRISDDVFALGGLQLDNNQPVALPEISQTKDYPLWRDGKLDKQNTAGKATQEIRARILAESGGPATPDRQPSRWPFFAGAVVLALVGCGLAYLASKARRAGT